ncbi:hypothetical protein JCM19037_4138 [Geomicrobium sp. JCM 19037]|nr:hypothetical protein JCM19037_4138 [Geomicrobium sp. JCM 19037]
MSEDGTASVKKEDDGYEQTSLENTLSPEEEDALNESDEDDEDKGKKKDTVLHLTTICRFK